MKERKCGPITAVLIAESIGRSFGRLLMNHLWILDKPYIMSG